eukprot:5793705-Pleurochrysis_carterae.AAC.1
MHLPTRVLPLPPHASRASPFSRPCPQSELSLYAEEGIACPPISYVDNAPCVELVESKPDGLIWLLEDECAMPKATDE